MGIALRVAFLRKQLMILTASLFAPMSDDIDSPKFMEKTSQSYEQLVQGAIKEKVSPRVVCSCYM